MLIGVTTNLVKRFEKEFHSHDDDEFKGES